MVISNTYNYLFIELPRTGTTALSHALCEHYEGEKKLNKHTNLHQAKKQLGTDFDGYFIFSCIRHPMDRTASIFVKYNTNYGNIRQNYFKKMNDIPRYKFITRYIHYKTYKRVLYAQRPGMTFANYFKKYYKAPYSDWAILDHGKMDYIIRFENLDDDFRQVCSLIGMEWQGEIQKRNVTSDKKGWQEYYTNELENRVKWVFSPYLQEFQYQFPGSETEPAPSFLNRLFYQGYNLFRKVIWQYFSSGK